MIELGFAIAEAGGDNIIVLGDVGSLYPGYRMKSAEFKGHYTSITHITCVQALLYW